MQFLYRLCGDRALAEDLTQDVFLKVWRAAAGWRPLGRVSTCLEEVILRSCELKVVFSNILQASLATEIASSLVTGRDGK